MIKYQSGLRQRNGRKPDPPSGTGPVRATVYPKFIHSCPILISMKGSPDEMETDNHLLRANNVSRTYQMGEETIQALRHIDLTVEEGESLLVLGPSGSGKSTLLHLLGALDRPTEGTITFRKREIQDYGDRDLSAIRNKHVGFVFQSFHLMDGYTAYQNVEMPLIYLENDDGNQRFDEPRDQRIQTVLEQVGLGDRLNHYPSQLSGGERQRVAIARAMAADPDIILADEPTGNLDSGTGTQVMNHLHQSAGSKRTLIMVSHDPSWKNRFDRVLYLKDGQLLQDPPEIYQPTP